MLHLDLAPSKWYHTFFAYLFVALKKDNKIATILVIGEMKDFSHIYKNKCKQLPKEKKIITCNLKNKYVKYILKHQRKIIIMLS